MAIAGKVGAVYMQTTDSAIAFNAEPMTNSGDNTRYYITDRDKAYWYKNATTTVYVDGVEETAVTIEYAGGYIEFDSALTGTETVTVTGGYLTVSQVAGFFSWSADVNSDMQESTTFGDSWKEFMPTLKDFTASAEKYWITNNISDRLGEEVVLVLYVDSGTNKNRYEGFALISSDSIEDSVDALINESIEFQGTGNLYYRED